MTRDGRVGVLVGSGREGSQLFKVIGTIVSKLLQCEDEGNFQLRPLVSAAAKGHLKLWPLASREAEPDPSNDSGMNEKQVQGITVRHPYKQRK
jgi:hypothetical protein